MVIQICLENNHLACFYLFWIFFYSDGEVRGLGCLGTISLCFLILQYISLFDLIFFLQWRCDGTDLWEAVGPGTEEEAFLGGTRRLGCGNTY